MNKILSVVLIYYLKLAQWSFGKAFLIAMPFVIVEYCLSLNGNKLANNFLNPVQIVIMTISFYLVNIWLLNVFYLKNPVNPIREGAAIIFIITALIISSNTKL